MFLYQGNEMKSKSQSQSVHSEDHLVILMDLPPAEWDCTVESDDASLNCAVTVSNGQEEMSPELQCCVEWLWAYFSELWTMRRLPPPFFHHPTLHGGLSVCCHG
uniref:Uncharacterized protein n=1 Tax=Hucho hucho TaxID=62062 RepID=A0A4W5PJ25_9TELE